jgi:hypothetical protein
MAFLSERAQVPDGVRPAGERNVDFARDAV